MSGDAVPSRPSDAGAQPRWRQLHPGASGFDDTRVLVTGGAGFIGSHLVEALLELGATAVVLDDLSGGDRANLQPFEPEAGQRLQFIEGSILDRDVLRGATADCEYVFHQAALGSVPRSVEQPRLYHDVNITGTLNVLEAARDAGVRRVMFAASSSAYGDAEQLPKTETMPPLPKSPYAASKVAGEALMRAWAGSYGLDTVSLRYFNIFGPRQNANSAYAAVIAAFAKALLAGERPVIFGDGSQSRDFTFVANAVHANLLAARAGATGEQEHFNGQVINVACGQRISVNHLAEKMIELLPDASGATLTPRHTDPRPGDVLHSLADLTRAREKLGYEPIVDFDAGLAATVRWYANRA